MKQQKSNIVPHKKTSCFYKTRCSAHGDANEHGLDLDTEQVASGYKYCTPAAL